MASDPICSLSVDLDNQWSYLKTLGAESWARYPSYLDRVIPIFLDLFDRRGITATFFVVGRDATLDAAADALASIAPAGHEIGNHSFEHEPWLHLYSDPQVREELFKADSAITEACGERPRGFRGPGYSLSKPTLDVLDALGYDYDATTLPTFIGPLARLYYFRLSGFDAEQRRQRSALFGSWRDALRPLRPYTWELEKRRLIEVPVTTMPVLRIPIHASYLLYLSSVSPAVARAYLRTALRFCRAARLEPSLLFHPLDVVGSDEIAGLEAFPAMGLDGAVKRERVGTYLDILAQHYRLVPLREHVELLAGRKLASRRPDFHLDGQQPPAGVSGPGSDLDPAGRQAGQRPPEHAQSDDR